MTSAVFKDIAQTVLSQYHPPGITKFPFFEKDADCRCKTLLGKLLQANPSDAVFLGALLLVRDEFGKGQRLASLIGDAKISVTQKEATSAKEAFYDYLDKEPHFLLSHPWLVKKLENLKSQSEVITPSSLSDKPSIP